MEYPNIEQVEKASIKQIVLWYIYLPRPEEGNLFNANVNCEKEKIERKILDRFNEAGGLRNIEVRDLYFKSFKENLNKKSTSNLIQVDLSRYPVK